MMNKEKKRYQRKGYGLIFATLIAVGFFTGVSHFGKIVWPQFLEFLEVRNISYTTMFLAVNIMIHNLMHLSANLIYWVFYHYEFPFIERYKNNENPWPWKEDPEGWRKLAKKAILVLIFNSNVMPVIIYQALDRFGLLEKHSMATEDIPDTVTIAGTIFFFMLCEDFTFYWSHRLLHHPRLYPHIHKMHHTFNTTVGIAAEYAHPVEFVLGNMLPTSVGPLILGPNVHVLVIFAWYTVRFGETLDGHCGYEFSWSPYRLIPFSGSAEYHDFHHSVNIGNYGSFFSIWDTVFGTNKLFYKHIAEREDLKSKENLLLRAKME
jgi:methylsterol monooxygenase/4-alpha-methyl-delta7-sterol-4alpha-methyl oxidase